MGLPSYLAFLGVKSIKFVFPRAPIRTITWPSGPEANVASWYNYYTRRDGCLEHDVIEQVAPRPRPQRSPRRAQSLGVVSRLFPSRRAGERGAGAALAGAHACGP
eukprot:6305842-Prymnesium_polylepis.1